MVAVHDGVAITDDERRRALYRGDIFVTSRDEAVVDFCDFAQELISEAFQGLDPELAQHDLPVEAYVEVLSSLKPRFIHHPRSKECLQRILERLGCDLEQTYFDVPRLRSSTSHGYLVSGIAYAWHPHRDTWYSAPQSQLNFWLPVYPLLPGNAMAFHPEHFARAVPNTSAVYNYYEWNSVHRLAASSHVGADSRPLPRPTAPVDVSEPLVILPAVGSMIGFSGQHLHSSVPNLTGRTRFSIDFRTVHIGDIMSGYGAPNADVLCTGSSIRDFHRAADLAPMPENVVDHFVDGTEGRGELVFTARPSST